MEIAIMYILTMLIPIHGALFLGIRWENEKKRALLKSLWTVHNRGNR